MECVYCNSDIENDSFHCDQCGKELFVCPTCNRTGKGKNCIHDGSKLVSPKQQSNPVSSTNAAYNNYIVQRKSQLIVESQQISNSSPSGIPILRLINNTLKLDIKVKNSSVLGREVGDFIEVFSKYSDVSSKHLIFDYDTATGWTVTDTGSNGKGSTFGTKVNKTPNWNNIDKLIPNEPTLLLDNTYLLIADVYEFHIRIMPELISPTGTKRQ